MRGTHDQLGRHATRHAVAAACGPASPLQATAAAPFWRALRDESAIWTLMQLPSGRERLRRGMELQH
jgi:hypothetical protein